MKLIVTDREGTQIERDFRNTEVAARVALKRGMKPPLTVTDAVTGEELVYDRENQK